MAPAVPQSRASRRRRCLAACGASAASGVLLPFRLDYVVKISTLRRLGGVRLGLGTIAVSIVALGMVDAVAMLPLALAALATSGPILRAPLIVVVLFCIGCLGVLTLGQRVARLPLIGRWNRLHTVYRRIADSTRFSRPTLVAGLLLLGCWTSRALGSTLLLSAIGVPFSPTLALVVLCMSAATAILPITAGGAVAGMGTAAGVLFALGVSKGAAVNFALASGLLLTGAALVAAVLGLTGSLLLTFRARRPLAAATPGTVADTTKKSVAVGDVARSPLLPLRTPAACRRARVLSGPRFPSASGEAATAFGLGRGVVELIVVIEGRLPRLGESSPWSRCWGRLRPDPWRL